MTTEKQKIGKSNKEIFEELLKGVEKKPCGCAWVDGKQVVCCARHNEISA